METARNLLEDFVQLFRGRGDAYGGWEGVCIRKPLTIDTFERHLDGSELFGVYPLVPYEEAWGCVWGCSDIDVDDLDAARNLQTAFAVKGIHAWVERTRKGYHVWVFANSLVPATTMRRAFLAAHQAIQYPAKEVNPKQEDPGAGFGNYVRLPYPHGFSGIPENRYVLDDNDEPMTLEQFVNVAMLHRTSRGDLQEIADKWVPPVKHAVQFTETTDDVNQLLRRMSPLPWVIWRDGPLEGRDRSSTMYRMTCLIRQDGFTPQETFMLVKTADERWGKFHLRRDCDKEIIRLVERVFSE